MPFDHFNLIASFYDRAGEFIIGEPLLGLLALSPKDLFLDVGGGTGRVAAAISGMAPKVFVVDVAWGMLRRAAGKGLAAVCSPAESLPFSSESITRILVLDALHHFLDQRLVARELWRVLSPGGRILVVEPDIHKLSAKLLAIGEKLLLMRSHFLTKEEITSLFSALDLKVNTYNDAFNLFVVAEKVL
jgi:demethylmenaquinone methyltransferase/2-methoxy-6-polyprenyl-1,4-benzoquinol methylase